jgi:hypothetical protein
MRGSPSRKIFTERLPELLDPSSRLTSRLRKTIQEIGLATCGKGGERLCPKPGIALSDTTLLWSLHLISIRIASREILPVGMNFVSLISSSVGGCYVFSVRFRLMADTSETLSIPVGAIPPYNRA